MNREKDFYMIFFNEIEIKKRKRPSKIKKNRSHQKMDSKQIKNKVKK